MKLIMTLAFIGILAFTFITFGCARHHSATATTTVESVDDQTTVATTTVGTDKSVEKNKDDVSIFGTVFNTAGEIIAFPFKLVAEMFRAIF